jgi:hypothetical protein
MDQAQLIAPVTNLIQFQGLKLTTKFIHIPTGRTFLLRRTTDTELKGTLYLWNKDNEEEHFDVIPSEWSKLEEQQLDIQAALIELLEHIHDGDRLEILYSLDNITDHLRYNGVLPIVRKDTAPPDNIQTVYIVPTHNEI